MKKTTQDFNAMLAGYDKLAATLMPDAPASAPIDDPVKLEWAKQEGFKPQYDPNADAVTWVQAPKAPYQQPELMRLQGSMSPEQLGHSFPMFAFKQQHLDGVLQEIISAALDGKITHQRANELAYQLAQDSYDEAVKQTGKQGTGAAANSADQSQTMSKALKGQKVAGK